MNEYRITWAIDLSADTPREAAERALTILRDTDPANIGLVFEVSTDSVATGPYVVTTDLSPSARTEDVDLSTDWTDADATRLAEAETEFEITGGRGVDLAEEIDTLRVKRAAAASSTMCRHCGRTIVNLGGVWSDPEAGYDDVDGDGMWRETCDAHDTFTAEHEPVESEDERDHRETEPGGIGAVPLPAWKAEDEVSANDILEGWVEPATHRDAVQAHIEAVCADAGLGVMVQVYEIVRDRGDVTDESLLALTAEDVTAAYAGHIGQAIDSVEQWLLIDNAG